MTWPVTTRRTSLGELEVGGVSASALAHEFGTPLYVFDEETLRARARLIRDTFLRAYDQSRIVYAGKAYLSPALMRILVEERVGLDVVSGGEIYAGLVAGVRPADMIFHGSNKSRAELQEAITAGVGFIALDNDLEITLLEAVSRESDREIEVVLRLNPGVDPHTHHKMRTGPWIQSSASLFGMDRPRARRRGSARLKGCVSSATTLMWVLRYSILNWSSKRLMRSWRLPAEFATDLA
jgi:diaminopimelate decarboxylase